VEKQSPENVQGTEIVKKGDIVAALVGIEEPDIALEAILSHIFSSNETLEKGLAEYYDISKKVPPQIVQVMGEETTLRRIYQHYNMDIDTRIPRIHEAESSNAYTLYFLGSSLPHLVQSGDITHRLIDDLLSPTRLLSVLLNTAYDGMGRDILTIKRTFDVRIRIPGADREQIEKERQATLRDYEELFRSRMEPFKRVFADNDAHSLVSRLQEILEGGTDHGGAGSLPDEEKERIGKILGMLSVESEKQDQVLEKLGELADLTDTIYELLQEEEAPSVSETGETAPGSSDLSPVLAKLDEIDGRLDSFAMDEESGAGLEGQIEKLSSVIASIERTLGAGGAVPPAEGVQSTHAEVDLQPVLEKLDEVIGLFDMLPSGGEEGAGAPEGYSSELPDRLEGMERELASIRELLQARNPEQQGGIEAGMPEDFSRVIEEIVGRAVATAVSPIREQLSSVKKTVEELSSTLTEEIAESRKIRSQFSKE
jgi:hypothetical protein